MLKLKESFGNVVGHVEIDGAGRILPVDVNASKEGAVPVHGDGVVFFRVVLGWRTWLRDVDLMPKLLTTRQKLMSCQTWHHKPGVCWQW